MMASSMVRIYRISSSAQNISTPQRLSSLVFSIRPYSTITQLQAASTIAIATVTRLRVST